MNKIKLTLLVLLGSSITTFAQSPKRSNRFPVGTFHKKNVNISGMEKEEKGSKEAQ